MRRRCPRSARVANRSRSRKLTRRSPRRRGSRPPPGSGCRPRGTTTLPSFSTSTRCARRATAGSWVTTISVRPAAFICSSSSSTWRPEAVSRLPVGSSASSSFGSSTVARASATRWRSPPESWSGRCWRARLEADGAQPRERALAPLGGRRAGEQHRQLDVLLRAEPRHQVEELEHEADRVAAHEAELGLVEPRRRRGRRARSGRESGRSRQPSTCRSVDLPEPDGPMIARYSPVRDLLGDVHERVHGLAADVVAAREAREPDHPRTG